jgi:hypothetical protein
MPLPSKMTESQIIRMVVTLNESSLPIFEALFQKHAQYIRQERDLEARAIGVAILEALNALEQIVSKRQPLNSGLGEFIA